VKTTMTEGQQKLPACYRCEKCGYHTAGYKPLCPQCGHAEMSQGEKTSTGKILDFVPVLYPPENLKDLGNYISLLVKLDNGCKMFGILMEDPERVNVGQKVIISKFNENTHELFFRIN